MAGWFTPFAEIFILDPCLPVVVTGEKIFILDLCLPVVVTGEICLYWFCDPVFPIDLLLRSRLFRVSKVIHEARCLLCGQAFCTPLIIVTVERRFNWIRWMQKS